MLHSICFAENPDKGSNEEEDVAETADLEVLESHTLVEVKHGPDWPSWKTSIEDDLATWS